MKWLRGGRKTGMGNPLWRLLGALGKSTTAFVSMAVYLTALAFTILVQATKPRHWRRTVRKAFSRQLLETGIKTIIPVGLVALFIGVLVVMQAQLWLGKLGQTEWLGPLFVVVVVRELAPLLTNLIMILQNGSKMTSELAGMTVSGKVRMLDAQGIDPLIYLILPRVTATVVSTFCLTLLFIVFSLVSGYLFSFALGLRLLAPQIFLDQILRALQSRDLLNLLLTGMIPPLLTAVICCSEGLCLSLTRATVPNATSLALTRSTVSLFLISVTISVLTYL